MALAEIPHLIWIGLAALIVLFLPGFAYLAWFPEPRQDQASRVADALGISVSITVLAALLTFLFQVRLSGPAVVIIYLLLGLLGVVGGLVVRHGQSREAVTDTAQHWFKIDRTLPVAFMLGVVLVAWRMYQARELVFPAWVDSLHHVLIVRVILEQGRIPADLSPYMPVPLYYHVGFHSLAAVFTFFSNLAPDRSVLIFGQILNAAVSLSVYRLAVAAWGDVKRGLIAALLVGFFAHMPAYYLTWGRYTLLTGLIVLPLAMAQAIEVLRDGPELARWGRWRQGSSLALLTAGVLLSHYLAALLLAVFLVLIGFQMLWKDVRQRRVDWQRWIRLVGGVAVGTLLALPWLIRVFTFQGNSLDIKASLPSADAINASAEYARYLWYLAGPRRNYIFLAFGGLGLLFAIKNRFSRALVIWGALLTILGLPIGIRIAPFRPDHLVIVLFLPAALFFANLLVSAAEALAKVFHRAIFGYASLNLVVILLMIWGTSETAAIVNPTTIIANAADRAALEWIQVNTPPDARFFVNTTLWQGVTYRGVDGGAWILTFTGRQTIMPPVVYDWGTKEYVEQINSLAKEASTIQTCSAQFWNLVKQARVNYIYLHQGKGSLQPGNLVGCQSLQVVFEKDDAIIYQVNP